MPRTIIQSKCKVCGICYKSCPVDAIIKAATGYLIVEEDCVDCGTCKRICKASAVEGNDPVYAGNK